MRKIIRKP